MRSFVPGSIPMAPDRARQALGHRQVAESVTQQRTVLADRVAKLRRETLAGMLRHHERGGNVTGAGRDPGSRSNELAKIDAFVLRPGECHLPSVQCAGSFVCRYSHRRSHPPGTIIGVGLGGVLLASALNYRTFVPHFLRGDLESMMTAPALWRCGRIGRCGYRRGAGDDRIVRHPAKDCTMTGVFI